MSGTEIDWIAITGILGTLGGVIVGAITTYKIQDNQIKHTNETRFHDQRLDAYTRYSGNIIKAVSYWYIGGHNAEAVTEAFESFEMIRIVGTKPVFQQAAKLNSIFGKMFACKDKKNIPQESRNQLNTEIAQLAQSARLELKIDNTH